MLGYRLSGAMFSENFGDLAQLMGHNFEGIPSDYRSAILQARPENPGETEALVNNPDGLHVIPDFDFKWNQVASLSSAVDELRADPASQALVKYEQGLSSQIMDALVRARNYYPWGSGVRFSRDPVLQAGLTTALGQLMAALEQYIRDVPRMIKNTQIVIQDRETAKNEAIQAEADARAKEDQARAKEAEAQRAASEAKRAASQADAFTAQTTELKTKMEYEKLVKKSEQTLIFGMPLSIVAPVGLAAAVGLFLVTRKRSTAPLSGYRRSNPSARKSRKIRRR